MRNQIKLTNIGGASCNSEKLKSFFCVLLTLWLSIVGILLIVVEENVVKVSDHCHAADARQSEKKVALSELRMKAVNSNSPPRRIIRATTAKMDTTSAVEMRSYQTLSRNIRRIRSNARITPTLPTSLTDLLLDDRYTKTIKGDNFVLYDNKEKVNRIIIFGTKENLTFLIHCDDWYMDGTFNITPPMFKQVYTIHGTFSYLLCLFR